jgi:hypothetical protein
MRIYLFSIILAGALISSGASAQVGIGIGVGPRMGFGGGYGGMRGGYPRRQKREQQPKFTPIVNLSFGYGFPNLDRTLLPDFYNYSRGSVTQTGPITGAIDVQYSRTASIGLMVTHGQVSSPYYDYNNLSGPPSMNGTLDNWSVMLNFIRYMPVSPSFTTYLRTAIGINIWNETYTDASGNKLPLTTDPSQLAYQIGLGAKWNFTKSTGLFMEAGYGKYILHGGLTFRL